MKLTARYFSTLCKCILGLNLAFALAPRAQAQQEQPQDSGTSTDFWIMPGSDFIRPGLAAKANYNIGIGHTFGFLKKDPIGDELTFGYTYEDAGPGFWHSQFGSDTESLGIMKNFGLPKTKRVTGYTWIQLGITSFTGNATVQNDLYDGESLGALSISTNTIPFGFKTPLTRWSRCHGTRRQASDTPGVGDSAGDRKSAARTGLQSRI